MNIDKLVHTVASWAKDIHAIEASGEYWYEIFVDNQWIKPGMRILDYGAGLGRLSIPFSRIAEVRALDVNPDMVAYLQSKGIAASVASDLQPVLDEKFDFAIAAYVLQHNDIIDAQVLTDQISTVTDTFYFTYPVVDEEFNRNLADYVDYKDAKKLPLVENTNSSRTMARSELPVLFKQSSFNPQTIISLGIPKLNLYRITK